MNTPIHTSRSPTSHSAPPGGTMRVGNLDEVHMKSYEDLHPRVTFVGTFTNVSRKGPQGASCPSGPLALTTVQLLNRWAHMALLMWGPISCGANKQCWKHQRVHLFISPGSLTHYTSHLKAIPHSTQGPWNTDRDIHQSIPLVVPTITTTGCSCRHLYPHKHPWSEQLACILACPLPPPSSTPVEAFRNNAWNILDPPLCMMPSHVAQSPPEPGPGGGARHLMTPPHQNKHSRDDGQHA